MNYQSENIRQKIRNLQPLIHCITNPISIHDCANIVLAAGGRPIMAEHPAEIEEITQTADALALNLGNITDARMESMPKALHTAAGNSIPVILDLVGVACSRFRYEFAQKLMRIHMPSILKGNMSELLVMAGETAHTTGVEAGARDCLTEKNRNSLISLFQEKAAKHAVFITKKTRTKKDWKEAKKQVKALENSTVKDNLKKKLKKIKVVQEAKTESTTETTELPATEALE